MEKWKIAVIVALLAALPVFGMLQNAENKPPSPEATPTAPSLEPPEALAKHVGNAPIELDIPAEHWTNAKRPVRLADYKGKVVLLEFWRHECSHCQEASPYVQQLQKELKEKGLEVIGVQSPAMEDTIEYDWPALKKDIQAKGIKHPMAYDEGRKIFSKYGSEKFPTFIVIGRDGKVAYANSGFTGPLWQQLLNEVKKALGAK